MNYRPELKVNGEWAGNGQVFETEAEALAAAKDIYSRWTISTGYRAVPTDKPVTSKREIPEAG